MIERMMQVGTLSLPGEDAHLPSNAAPRGARVRALLWDVGGLVFGALISFVVGVTYLLMRTTWGTYDAGDFDSALATALVLAVPPTQAGWLLLSVAERGATPGQRRAGLAIARREGEWRAARIVRMALHPLSLPAWLWLAAMLFLLAVPVLPWLVVLWSGLLAIGVLSSIVIFAIRPAAPAVHDLLARTRVVVRP